MLVETTKDCFQHVLVDHETREHIIRSDPLIKSSEDQPLIALRDRRKSLSQRRIFLREDDPDLFLRILEPILLLIDQLMPIKEGNPTMFVIIHQLYELLNPHHRNLPLLVL